MFSFRRWLVCATLAAGSQLGAAPPLTTIQDVLYTADGKLFSGSVTISWQSFEASDASNIAAQSKTLEIANGFVRVQLVPTTNANTLATYAVRYNSDGRIQFTETWGVPPSTLPLRVRDVRLAPGSVGVPPPVVTTVQISDVVGLQNELNLRPTIGTGFAVSRTAVINATGSIDGAVGTLSDCVHVDGTSGPCGNAGGVGFADGEVPGGAVDGSNATFTLVNAPSPSVSLSMFRNGLLLKQPLDYTLANNTITFTASTRPQPGDTLQASYRNGVSLPGVGFVDNETPAGTINGANALFTLSQAPNPASSLAVYRNGIRLKLGVDYTASANSITFGAGAVPQAGDILAGSYRIVQ